MKRRYYVVLWTVCMIATVFLFIRDDRLRRDSEDEQVVSLAVSDRAVLRGVVARVKDGDTIVVRGVIDDTTIRLVSVDAPESKQPFGEAAKKYLESLCLGKVVYAEIVGQDRYKRTLAVVYVSDRPASMNAEMVFAGLAWRYRTDKNEWLGSLEKTAQESRSGLWSSDDRIAPWDWRKGAR